MRARPSAVFPKHLFAALRRTPVAIAASGLVLEASTSDAAALCERMSTDARLGLTPAEAERRLLEHGQNVVATSVGSRWWRRLLHVWINPLVILLCVLATISFSTGDPRAGTVVSLMIALGVALRFTQENRADRAAAKLKAMISVTATVVRGGEEREIAVTELVPGDVVRLSAGDMVPGDVRLLACKDLFLIQGSLTGESLPVEKFDARWTAGDRPALERTNLAFLGTSVESGAATALIVATGRETYLGRMASALGEPATDTSFDRGVARFTWLMLAFMAVMVPLVFVLNGLTKGNWGEAFFFGLAVAVGLTPEMLPMIVTVCLAKGAIAMSKQKVIVKRLNAIQNLGAMDVLCTDKTGTLTLDRVILERHCDVVLDDDEEVLALAYLNSRFQTGLENLLDRAVLAHVEMSDHPTFAAHTKVDEIPFDFSRRVMSVVVRTPSGNDRIVTKGAPESVFERCANFELAGELMPMNHVLIYELKEEYERLSSDGFRVLAIAYKDVAPKASYGKDDERDLTLRGYLAFLDPPKESAVEAIAALRDHGIVVKVVTGDNELVSRKICAEVGLAVERVVLGAEVEKSSDVELAELAERTTLFARVSPAHKQRIIRALQARKHTVGFLGDGINDAPALRVSDVGISVDSAVDIAKESADLILLEKNLRVLDFGVIEGRKVFVNILKYVRMGASSNFGNMFSVLGASVIVPYLPMTPIQILTNNLLYDFSQIAIPTDNVDAEQVLRPRPWAIGEITKFILFIGPCSSVFDYTTYFLMLYAFGCADPDRAALFRSGWFVESLLTQTLIVHVIRTQKIPFVQSRASWQLLTTTVLVMAIASWLPYSPIGPYLGFAPLPFAYWPAILATLVAYVALTHRVKTWLAKRGWL